MVIDFGGGTCDITVVKTEKPSFFSLFSKENIQIVYSEGNNQLGGELINKVIERKFIKDRPNIFDERSLGDIKRKVEGLKLRLNENIAEACKEHLQNYQQGNAQWPEKKEKYFPEIPDSTETIGITEWSLSERQFVNILSKEKYKELKNRTISQAFEDLVCSVSEKCGGFSAIDRVFVVGGSSYLYFVIPVLHWLFRDLIWDKTLFRPDWPEKVVALGAAAHEISRQKGKRVFDPKFFYDMDIVAAGGRKINLIKSRRSLPVNYAQTRSDPFRVLEQTDSLILEMRAEGDQSLLDDLEIKKQLNPINSKIAPNEHEFVASASVSVDGIIAIKVIEKDRKVIFEPFDIYPLAKDKRKKARKDFERKFVDAEYK